MVSGNLDQNFTPLGSGIITVIDPATMTPIDTIESGGTNSSAAAVGPDGLVYVVNTEDFVADGSVTVIDPSTLQVVKPFPGSAPARAVSTSTPTAWPMCPASSPGRWCGTRRPTLSFVTGPIRYARD